jgi:hypothetical protein
MTRSAARNAGRRSRERSSAATARGGTGRYPQCKACVREWQQENAGHLADYHRRWHRANRDKQRAQTRRYRERKRTDPDYRDRRRANARRRDQERRAQDPDYVERRRENNRRYRERKRARLSNAPPEGNDGLRSVGTD